MDSTNTSSYIQTDTILISYLQNSWLVGSTSGSWLLMQYLIGCVHQLNM